MAQQVRRRQHTIVDYQANGKVSKQLSRGMLMRHLALNLSGQITTSAGTDNDAADTKPGEEWGCVQRIDIVANGSDVLKSMPGEALAWFNYFWFGQANADAIGEVGAGGDDPSFDSTLILPFWMPRSVRPIDTVLDARKLADLRIEVTWADQNGILRPAGASAFTTDPTIDVFSLESFNPPGNSTFNQWRISEISETITAADSRHQIQLPVGHIYRSFLINTQAGADVDNLADVSTMINRIKLVSGTTVYADLTEEVLAQEYLLMNGLPKAPTRISSVSDRVGWYMLDLVTDGRLSEGIDTLGMAELTLEIDIAAPSTLNKLRVYPSTIIPVRG